MALIKCPECGKEVSDKAKSCPNCGCPIDIMEKFNVKCTINNKTYDFTKIKHIVETDILDGEERAYDELLEITELEDKECSILASFLYCNLGTIPEQIDINEIKQIDIFKLLDENMKKEGLKDKIKEERNSNKPKCPTCHSTNIQKISGAERMTSVLGLGILSKKINKTYKCKYCGYTW